jgi:large subunit ribosomal protein L15
MKLHDLKPAEGSRQEKRRVGRGIGGKGGKTAGRGTKGQKARNNIKPGFEGGQLPLTQRIPKLKGFRNPFRIEYSIVNLDTISKLDETSVTPELLYSHGIVPKKCLIKVLGRGEVTKAYTVKAHSFSESARTAITGAGGTCEVIELPYKSGRPPVSGNALSNR